MSTQAQACIEYGKGEFTSKALHKQKSEQFDQTMEGPLHKNRISLNPVQNNEKTFTMKGLIIKSVKNRLLFMTEFVNSVVHCNLKKVLSHQITLLLQEGDKLTTLARNCILHFTGQSSSNALSSADFSLNIKLDNSEASCNGDAKRVFMSSRSISKKVNIS